MNGYAKHSMALTLLVLLASGIASAQKTKVDYDRSVGFSKFKTYTWAELDPARLPMLRASIIGAINGQLAAKGLQEVAKDGDLMVAYSGDMIGEQNQGVFAPSYPGFAGQPPAIDSTMWTGQAGASAPSMSVAYPKGTLVIELMDPHARKIIWRAVGGAKLDIEKKSDSLVRVNRLIVSMFEQYPPSKK